MVNCLRTCRRAPRPRRSKRVSMISLHSPNERVRVQRRPVHAFTVDLEDYYHIHAYSRVISKESWAAYPARVEDGLNRVLGMLDEFGVRATIFVLGWLAERKKRLVRQCRNLGHEIACHGFDHQAIYLNGPSHFREDIRRSKSLLEDIIGAPVLGFRAPTYSITPKTMWALRIIAEEGFVYDSSLVSIRHDYYGFPGAREEPFVLRFGNSEERLRDQVLGRPASCAERDGDGLSLAEFPIRTARFGRLRIPVCGGGYFRFWPYTVTFRAMKRMEEEGNPFIFYIHPWEVCRDLPRVPGVGFRSRFRTHLNLGRTENRLRRLLKDFRFSPAEDVLDRNGYAFWRDNLG